MAVNRIDELLEFLEEEPNDPFLLYALATEYLKTDKTKALEYFQLILKVHEEYPGTYYHAAQLMSELGFIEEAQSTYLKGIKICEKLGKQHILKELKNAYQNFLFNDYE